MTIGLTADYGTCQYRWLSGEPITYTNWHINEPRGGDACDNPYVIDWTSSYFYGWYTLEKSGTPVVLELPGTVTDEQLEQTRQNIIDNALFKDFYNNAILNQWWDNNPNHWLRFQMDKPREYNRYITEITGVQAQEP